MRGKLAASPSPLAPPPGFGLAVATVNFPGFPAPRPLLWIGVAYLIAGENTVLFWGGGAVGNRAGCTREAREEATLAGPNENKIFVKLKVSGERLRLALKSMRARRQTTPPPTTRTNKQTSTTGMSKPPHNLKIQKNNAEFVYIS